MSSDGKSVPTDGKSSDSTCSTDCEPSFGMGYFSKLADNMASIAEEEEEDAGDAEPKPCNEPPSIGMGYFSRLGDYVDDMKKSAATLAPFSGPMGMGFFSRTEQQQQQQEGQQDEDRADVTLGLEDFPTPHEQQQNQRSCAGGDNNESSRLDVTSIPWPASSTMTPSSLDNPRNSVSPTEGSASAHSSSVQESLDNRGLDSLTRTPSPLDSPRNLVSPTEENFYDCVAQSSSFHVPLADNCSGRKDEEQAFEEVLTWIREDQAANEVSGAAGAGLDAAESLSGDEEETILRWLREESEQAEEGGAAESGISSAAGTKRRADEQSCALAPPASVIEDSPRDGIHHALAGLRPVSGEPAPLVQEPRFGSFLQVDDLSRRVFFSQLDAGGGAEEQRNKKRRRKVDADESFTVPLDERVFNGAEFLMVTSLPGTVSIDGGWTDFARTLCWGIVAVHTVETLLTNFGSKAWYLHLPWAFITPAQHVFCDCVLIGSAVVSMLLWPDEFGSYPYLKAVFWIFSITAYAFLALHTSVVKDSRNAIKNKKE